MKPIILSVSSASFCKHPTLIESLRKSMPNGTEIRTNLEEKLSPEALIQLLTCADYAIIGKEPMTHQILAACPSLRLISKYGVGLDNIDENACKKFGVGVYHEPGVNSDGVAEFTLGLILSSLRNISLTDRLMHGGTWLKNGGRSLGGSRVGVVGVGHIGSRVARLLRAFSCEVLLCDILDKRAFAETIQARCVTLEELLLASDVVTLHTPLTPQTRQLINQNTLSLMKPHAHLINTSRGEVIQEDSLYQALVSGKLAGAALDVFAQEPCPESPLVSLPQVVSTPHIAGNSQEAVLAMGLAAIRGILKELRVGSFRA